MYKIKVGKATRRITKIEAEKIFNGIISEIAVSENLSIKEVSNILQYTYGWIVSKIREGKGEGIRIKNWGAFAIKPFQRKKLQEYIEKEKENEKNRTENKGKSV